MSKNTDTEEQIKYLRARIWALEREVKRLNVVVNTRENEAIRTHDGFKIDIKDPLFHKPLKDFEVNT